MAAAWAPAAQPGGSLLSESLDLAIAGVHRLVAAVHDPRIGVSGTGPQRRLNGGFGVFEHC